MVMTRMESCLISGNFLSTVMFDSLPDILSLRFTSLSYLVPEVPGFFRSVLPVLLRIVPAGCLFSYFLILVFSISWHFLSILQASTLMLGNGFTRSQLFFIFFCSILTRRFCSLRLSVSSGQVPSSWEIRLQVKQRCRSSYIILTFTTSPFSKPTLQSNFRG